MKDFKKHILIVLLLFTTFCFSQDYFFNDDFNDNSKKWYVGNTNNFDLKVFNGRYYYEYKNTEKNLLIFSPKFKINTSDNFEMESSIQKISGVQDYGYGMFIQKENKDRLELTITSNGYYQINQKKNGSFTTIHKWTKSEDIKKGNYAVNTLKIKKNGTIISFYVNNKLLISKSISEVYGNSAGYIINRNQKISIDYLRIKKATKNSYNNNITSVNTSLNETFSSNSNKWTISNNEFVTYDINSGKYYLEHKKEKGGYSSTINNVIDETKDFEFETKIDKISGVTNYSYGIMWGKKSDSSFRFYITSNGYYKFVRNVKGKEEKIINWKTTSFINKKNGASNIIKIKKQNNRYLFYINGNYINESDFEPFYGNHIGFILFNKQKIAIDYLKVKQNKNSNNNNNSIVAKQMSVPVSDNFTNNNNGWILNSTDNYSAEINNGKFVLDRKIKGGIFFKNEIDLNTQKDFILETSFTKQTGASNLTYGLTFGRKNSANEYSFFLSNTGQYLYRKYENNKYSAIIPWTQADVIKTNLYQENVIKIVKSNQLLRFYINNVYVNEFPFEGFFGNKIGFTVYDKQKIAVNYFRVKYQTTNHNNPPIIVISEPNVEEKRGFKIVKAKKITVRGHASDSDGIYEILINGVEANVSENGNFVANVPLKYGKNELIVSATDLKQATTTKKFTIKRKSNTNFDTNSEVITNNANQNIDLGFGKYYALIIGVSDYEDESIDDLEGKPLRDAEKLRQVLTQQYNFNSQNVIVLKNPKDNEINRELFKLRKKITTKDNLLLFYAGHGVFQDEIGSWLPSNAIMEYEENLFSNSSLVDHFKAIKSKHTLLISDACFSGSIFKTRDVTKTPKSIQRKFELPSKKAITSGTLKTVPNESVFFKYLIKRLENNPNKYLSARKLFDMIEDPVINNSENKPQYGTIHGIGDEGGDFIFIKK
ncbi:caspase family protein [Tenacibaculum aquimarinum]|uniref:caspase family protein n=1 Tax=Tenacibaculum aquimarinum TaxID=2910675 RepID=UPI001F0AD25B|nr:caspase family protein [Tenacibaculum aquimarinum]MCH3885144.1 caspase family protein [Tenacibaculum aquimarinum]